LLVTSRSFYAVGRARRALAAAVPGAHIRGAGFGAVLLLDAEGDALELAARVSRECAGDVSRVMAVCAQVPSGAAELREAAVRVGSEQIGEAESFCFRLRKRGAHGLPDDTPALEREIGGAIWVALEGKHGGKPKVDLGDPDVAIRGEVLGPIALVCVQRRDWRGGEAV
jgi:tRNA(Ser,Leu) C12 N-acetylase TAN1